MPGTAQGNIFAAISNSYYHLTASEKKVADYVQSHKTDVQFMSISDLAEACGLADATVSRFCRRMKLRGYSDFKLALAKASVEEKIGANTPDAVPAPQAEGDIPALCRQVLQANTLAIKQSMERVRPQDIEAAVSLLTGAARVWCMGQGGSMLLADEAAHLFSTVCANFFSVADSHAQISRAALFAPEDVLFFFSYSGATKEMMDVVTQAKERGAKIVLITRFPKSPGGVLADVTLQCGSDEGPLQMGSMPARMAQLYLVDVLFHAFCRRNQDLTACNRERITDALAEKHL